MLTPLDIQNKEFTKGLRGYKEIEVDSFLDEIIVDYEQVYKENLELKDKISMLNDQIKHYAALEDTLQKTLIVAQTTAEEVIVNARKKGDLIIEESEEKAKNVRKTAEEELVDAGKKANNIIEESEKRARSMIEKAQDEVVKIKNEYESTRKDMIVFKTRFKALLNSQIETIESYIEEDDGSRKNLNHRDRDDEFEFKGINRQIDGDILDTYKTTDEERVFKNIEIDNYDLDTKDKILDGSIKEDVI
ncbi:cell-division initiation protein [Gottschalkia acidurici 9a]|uniref:Cell-division initiation protein n=1 Tax=Gottschalkia acidurici (strain ATCC 7906 / DSM 604 / BCRC 14475 / CIP 104303 / KCTC 5404 / NCIMB 10678 / 9a) TaxID=1128398 RepID=K0B213_GOTA9|nr:DivIVA domain-containing protein [Gottschalkia acidurici]AFS78706.1 cell-division initiation protein [Gottschalkia acidurici 9a]